MGYYYSASPFRDRIPTVVVRLATDEGEVAIRVRWWRSPIELQRRILFRLRLGKPVWLQDERGRDLCFKPEAVWGAIVDGRTQRPAVPEPKPTVAARASRPAAHDHSRS